MVEGVKSRSEERFFTKLDWAAFWTATLVTFAVYFFTLGPSVGLEDSGELATAGAHLGVPHPPGYPFWTLCSWIFCKLFSWVTYMGHPTPAWAISCFSAVAGAFAAGCTAMLICRSAHDFVGGTDGGSGAPAPLPMDGSSRILAFGGGVEVRGYASGSFEVKTAWDGPILASIPVEFTNVWTSYTAEVPIPDGINAIYFTYRGPGSAALNSFTLS